MKRNELKQLIREVIKEFAPLGVADEVKLDEIAPPHFPRALEKKLLAQYKDTPQKAYATMWKIHNAKNEGNQRVCEMWAAWENKSINEGIAEEDPNNPLYVEYVSDRQGEDPFMMSGQKFRFVNAKYPNGKKDIGVYAFSGDVVYAYDAFRKMYNLKEEEVATPQSQEAPHDETDLSNPEEAKEVELAIKIKTLADEILGMHGANSEEGGGAEGTEGTDEKV